MGVKKFNPTSPGRRSKRCMILKKYDRQALRAALKGNKEDRGRNNSGCVTSWQRGGGNRDVTGL